MGPRRSQKSSALRATGRRWRPALALCICLMAPPWEANAVSAWWSFDEAYHADATWYLGANNDDGLLAWDESTVMMALAEAYSATGHLYYLEELAIRADAALAQRDDIRGVRDYRGVSAACWRNLSYQPGREAYCWVVHSGMIAYPMVQLAILVEARAVGDEIAPSGETFGEVADRMLEAGRAVAAAHEDQWDASGFYFGRVDATFLPGVAGIELPLNMSNAMGRLLLALHDATGELEYLEKATALAERFAAQLTLEADDTYLWNYWGGTYVPPGEDISHAALNVDFAARCAERGIVFGAEDIARFANTFLNRVSLDDQNVSDFVSGGTVNDPTVRPQMGLWLPLSPDHPAVYAAVRNLFERDYPADVVGSASILLAWALLASLEPPHCVHFFYSVDWDEPDAGWRQALAYGANVLTVPPDFSAPCIIPVEVVLSRWAAAQQWDGAAYHTVARWHPSETPMQRWIAYDPSWPFVYWDGGVLFQFQEAFTGAPWIRVLEPEVYEPPAILSTAPGGGPVGEALRYEAVGTGSEPHWWALDAGPTGARVDPASGVLTYPAGIEGEHRFVLSLRSDWGQDEQSFVYTVEADPAPEPEGPSGDAPPIGDVGSVDADMGVVDAERDADASELVDADAAFDASDVRDADASVSDAAAGDAGDVGSPWDGHDGDGDGRMDRGDADSAPIADESDTDDPPTDAADAASTPAEEVRAGDGVSTDRGGCACGATGRDQGGWRMALFVLLAVFVRRVYRRAPSRTWRTMAK